MSDKIPTVRIMLRGIDAARVRKLKEEAGITTYRELVMRAIDVFAREYGLEHIMKLKPKDLK